MIHRLFTDKIFISKLNLIFDENKFSDSYTPVSVYIENKTVCVIKA